MHRALRLPRSQARLGCRPPGRVHEESQRRGVVRTVDAKAGNLLYLLGLLLGAGRRAELLRTGAEAIGTLLAMGIILDVVFQFVLYRSVHPAHPVALGEEVSILFSWRRVRYHSRFILHEAEDASKKPER